MFSYLITMIAGIFWLFRVVVAITYTLGANFPIIPIDFNMEVILLFVTIICMIFIIKRNIFGALVYFFGYGYYFGNDLYTNILKISNEGGSSEAYLSVFVSVIGVIIPLLIVLDIFFNKDRKQEVRNKKTDWFYKNEQYDRNLDDRADKNQYKF